MAGGSAAAAAELGIDAPCLSIESPAYTYIVVSAARQEWTRGKRSSEKGKGRARENSFGRSVCWLSLVVAGDQTSVKYLLKADISTAAVANEERSNGGKSKVGT